MLVVCCLIVDAATVSAQDTLAAFQRVKQHEFQPLNEDGSFTSDRERKTHGVADLTNDDWRVRLLAIRDVVRSLPTSIEVVNKSLTDENQHVRQIAAAAIGIAGPTSSDEVLMTVLENDASALVRAQAAMSLGQLQSRPALELLKTQMNEDASKDVRHQCELAIDQIEKEMGATAHQRDAFRSLDESTFKQLALNEPAPDFTLNDTAGMPWTLRTENKNRWVVLVWIFADWCPVCHGEFNDLIELKSEFADAQVSIATIECHDRYRTRLMAGQETDAKYWFAKSSFQQKYRDSIWWPHLADLAGAVGARYGVDPMAFAVHAEYVNRPSTIIIDPSGVVRFAYYGTFWGDRPSMRETLAMIKTEQFTFSHPRRLK